MLDYFYTCYFVRFGVALVLCLEVGLVLWTVDTMRVSYCGSRVSDKNIMRD